jgi:uncharacterized membrane protein HdeD (DUF308 family)
MVETKYKDYKSFSKYHERPSVVEWIGIVLVITGSGLALLTVAQKIAMGYYAVGLVLVGIGSALMFYRLPQKEEQHKEQD